MWFVFIYGFELKGYWVSCAVEAGSLRDYCWAGNRLRREYTEARLCSRPLSDHCPGLSCIHQAPRDRPALGGELLNSMFEPRSERTTSERHNRNRFGFLPAVLYRITKESNWTENLRDVRLSSFLFIFWMFPVTFFFIYLLFALPHFLCMLFITIEHRKSAAIYVSATVKWKSTSAQ